jgi:hypothetical protein
VARSRAWYRASQFFSALNACVREEDREFVRGLLPGPLLDHFLALKPEDQQHSIAVCRLLMKAGCRDPDLLRAALLHDIGKGRPSLWQRVFFVLLEPIGARTASRAVGSLVDRLAWYRKLQLQEEEAARMMTVAGDWGPLTRLVAGSPATTAEELRVLVLRAADDAC